MANTGRAEAECYISIEAECQVLYFTYSTWQGNDLSVIKNFLNNHLPPLTIPSLPTLTINYIELTQFMVYGSSILRMSQPNLILLWIYSMNAPKAVKE